MSIDAVGGELTPDMVRALDWVPTIIWVAAPNGACRLVNRAWRDFTGRRLAESVGEGWLAAMHPEDAAAWPVQIREALESLKPFSVECRLRRRDGRYRVMHKSGEPYRDEAGNVLGFIGHCVDVTNHKQALEDLRKASEKHRSVLSNLKDAVAVIEDFLRTEEPAALTHRDDRLTPRQREILHLIARGYATREIASQLHVSVKTVETHRTHIMEKLDLHSRTELIKFALRQGVIRIE